MGEEEHCLIAGQAPLASTKRSTFSYSIRMASSVFGLSEKIQIAGIKAASIDAGLPREKHLNVILAESKLNPAKIDLLLTALNAGTKWRINDVVSCKILLVILVLLQRGPSVEDNSMGGMCAFLDLIEEHWSSRRNIFLTQFSLVIKQRLNFIMAHRDLSNLISLSNTDIDQWINSNLESTVAMAVLSRLLSNQDRIMATMEIALQLQNDSPEFPSFSAGSIDTYLKTSLNIIQEGQRFHSLIKLLFGFFTHHCEQFASDTVRVLRDQFDFQTSGLSKVYESLKSLLEDLPGFPSRNPFHDRFAVDRL